MTLGYVLAGLVNVVGMGLFSRGLTNGYLGELFPEVLGRFGIVCIMLWGLAYLSVARKPQAVPMLSLVFALEKLIYVGTWIVWMSRHAEELPKIWGRDPMTATFFVIYGPNDFLFGAFFAWCWWRFRRGT